MWLLVHALISSISVDICWWKRANVSLFAHLSLYAEKWIRSTELIENFIWIIWSKKWTLLYSLLLEHIRTWNVNHDGVTNYCVVCIDCISTEISHSNSSSILPMAIQSISDRFGETVKIVANATTMLLIFISKFHNDVGSVWLGCHMDFPSNVMAIAKNAFC